MLLTKVCQRVCVFNVRTCRVGLEIAAFMQQLVQPVEIT